MDIEKYPSVKAHLMQYKERLEPRPAGWKGVTWPGRKPGKYQWYEIQDTVDYYMSFEQPKIIYPDIAKESRATLDRESIFLGNTAYIIPINDLYLLGILNSKLVFAYYKRIASVLGDADKGGRLRWFTQEVVKIPIRPVDPANPADVARHDQIVSLVDQMLGLNKKLAESKVPQTTEMLRRQIESTDRQIDQLVYRLYDLTEEEIKIVESET